MNGDSLLATAACGDAAARFCLNRRRSWNGRGSLGGRRSNFISYRRDDARGEARSIRDRLARKFGEPNVFMDVDSLLAGQRFDHQLDAALAHCDVLLALIGPRWMELFAERAKADERDYVRDEIAAALERDIVVIPVLVGQEGRMPQMPRAADLPEDIRDLILPEAQHRARKLQPEHRRPDRRDRDRAARQACAALLEAAGGGVCRGFACGRGRRFRLSRQYCELVCPAKGPGTCRERTHGRPGGHDNGGSAVGR